ncbi:TcpE family conjugal transfer membrane protein [Enterococcus faecalis]|nr:TcpE family conjugal transfer membrane protein [Enterococcus faecalis]
MMEWEPYNYTIVFKEPYHIQEIPNVVRLPFSIVLVDLVTGIIIAGLVRVLFGGIVAHLQETIPFMNMLSYIAVPVTSVMLLNKVQPDGKKIHYYLWDTLIYYGTIEWVDIAFCCWTKVKRKEINESVKFN